MREDSNKLFNLEISLTGDAVSYLAARKIVSIVFSRININALADIWMKYLFDIETA